MMEMKEKNPYSLGFGKAPKQYISRKRLIKRGIVNGDEWGRVSFTLPLFDEFVLTNYE